MPSNSALGSVASSADACMSIVHSLMCYRQGGESEAFAKRAIECLVKKLKDKPDELDGLIQAITVNGSVATKCATIPRTLDGRLQVAGKKVFPHVIYARIWRWSDIQKSELKHINYCQFAFDLKQDSVCVNPYHYERVISPGIDLNLPCLDYQHGNGHADMLVYEADDSVAAMPRSSNICQPLPGELPPMLLPHMPSNMDNRRPNYNVVHSGQNDMQPESTFKTDREVLMAMGAERSFGDARLVHTAPYWNGSEPQSSAANALQELAEPMISLMKVEQQMWEQQRFELALRNHHPPAYWCSIAYFELDQQVGETFKVRSAYPTVEVDGFAHPGHSHRFCLGPLTNVHRTEASERTRLQIGKGISLEYREDNGIWLQVLGGSWTEGDSYSVFVQSFFLDREAGRSPGDAVHKVHAFSPTLKIFDLKHCYNQMIAHLERTQILAQAQVAAVTGRSQNHPNAQPITMISSTGIGADDLRRFCVLRLSFLKGWGPDYRRKTIQETPCWVEIHVNRGLQFLDEVLRNAPSNEPRTMTEYS